MRRKTIIITIIILITLLGVGNLVVSNQVSTLGSKLQALNHQTLSLRQQNQALQQQIAQLTSLSYLQTQAEKLGFKPNTNTVNLTADQTLAKRQ